MEGIVFDTTFIETLLVPIGGAVLLGLVVAGAFFGYMAEEERGGKQIHWSAEPIPGTEEVAPHYEEPEVRKAA